MSLLMKQTIFPHQFIANPELIHRWANERYWDDELPNDVDVVYAKINHEASFKAKGRLRQYHLIELNEKLKDDPDKLLSVLVHKQIHLWQLVSSVRKSDSDYLDKEISTWIRHQHEAGREMKRFHGPSFYSQFARLHSDFGELKIDLSFGKADARSKALAQFFHDQGIKFVVGNDVNDIAKTIVSR